MSTTVNEKKPVDDPVFWRERLKEAKTTGDIRNAVFQDGNWAHIDRIHGAILGGLLDPRDEILDAGCGFGRAAPLMLGRRYVGVDLSRAFITEARMIWRDSLKLAFRDVSFEVGDLADLDFPNESFDWAVCISMRTMIVSNIGWSAWDEIRQELLRVTKKGVIILEYTDPEIYDVIKRKMR